MKVVISDIHIGTNEPTCWYQKDHHEKYLIKVFDWIINTQKKSKKIDELIILGDLFDFWTYSPNTKPPKTQEILNANPNIFGEKGKLSEILTLLKGNVSYINGNHDITITQKDLNKIPNSNDYKIKKRNDIYKKDDVIYTHGHLFTMFNAPDPNSEIPIGYFVTRSIAYKVEQEFKENHKTAADLPSQGSYGFDLGTLLKSLLEVGPSGSITDFLLDYSSKMTGLDVHHPIIMSDGSTKTIADAKKDYGDLYKNWVKEYGLKTVLKSMIADLNGTYMGLFGQKAALENNAIMTVTGHTHQPKVGISGAFADYINCGFECVSKPDTKRKKFTFSVIGEKNSPFPFPTRLKDKPDKSLYEVVKDDANYKIKKVSNCPSDKIAFFGGRDLSCYVAIENSSEYDLKFISKQSKGGNYFVVPPDIIPAGKTGMFWLQDDASEIFKGSTGSVRYSLNGRKINFEFSCPAFSFKNKCFVTNGEFYARTNKEWIQNKVKKGHPVSVYFKI